MRRINLVKIKKILIRENFRRVIIMVAKKNKKINKKIAIRLN
jgi:hypothetical protein